MSDIFLSPKSTNGLETKKASPKESLSKVSITVDTTLDAVLPAQHNTANIGAIFLSDC